MIMPSLIQTDCFREAMMIDGVISRLASKTGGCWIVLMMAAIFSFGCGNDSNQTTTSAKYPTGVSEDVEQQLKYDARVDSYDASGDTLTVNVNHQWLNSPPGMQERSAGQWYSLWHAGHNGGVTIQHDGNKIASWTNDRGYKPETKKKDEPHSES